MNIKKTVLNNSQSSLKQSIPNGFICEPIKGGVSNKHIVASGYMSKDGVPRNASYKPISIGVELNPNITTISLQLNGKVSVNFIESKSNRFNVENVRYKGIHRNPIRLIQKNGSIIITHHGDKSNSYSISYTLHVPMQMRRVSGSTIRWMM